MKKNYILLLLLCLCFAGCKEKLVVESDHLPIADPYVMLYEGKYYAYGTGGRFTLELDLVAHRLTFRGVNRKISIEDDDSSFEVCYGNSFNTLFNRIICTYSPL